MKPRKEQALRCAIYTRKSSEEGLEQEFNSLHAQREACEAYIRSQHGEGWRLLKTPYDDGGLSGASDGAARAPTAAGRHRRGPGRCGGGLQSRSTDPRAGGLRPHGRALRCGTRSRSWRSPSSLIRRLRWAA